MFVMRMRIRLNLNFIAFSPHESKPRCVFESFSAKTEINPTIMRSGCLSIVIYSVHEHSMESYRDAYWALPWCGVTGVTSDAVVPSTCRLQSTSLNA